MSRNVRIARRLAVLSALAACAAGALGAASPAVAADNPDLAVDPSGNASFAWSRNDGGSRMIQERRRTAAGALEDGQDVSFLGEDGFTPRVAIAPDGTAILVWASFTDDSEFVIQTRSRAPDGSLSAIQSLSAPGQNANNAQVAVDPSGNATFVWERFNGTNFIIQTRRRLANGTLEATKDISAAGQNAFSPQVAIASDGVATFVWARSNGSNFIIQTRRRLAGGTFDSTKDISALGQDAARPQVHLDPSGNATFVWGRSNGTNTIIQGRRRLASGSFEAAQDLSAIGQSADFPQLAVDADGNAIFVWERSNGTNTIVQTRRRLAAGTLETTKDLSAPGQNAHNPKVEIDSDGVATFVWNRLDGVAFIVQTRRRLANGTIDTTRDLSAPGADTRDPGVAVGPAGTADYVWERAGVIQTRRRTSPTTIGATVNLSD